MNTPLGVPRADIEVRPAGPPIAPTGQEQPLEGIRRNGGGNGQTEEQVRAIEDAKRRKEEALRQKTEQMRGDEELSARMSREELATLNQGTQPTQPPPARIPRNSTRHPCHSNSGRARGSSKPRR